MGPGNHCAVIKSLLKNRFWWQLTEDMGQADFIWTQGKVHSAFKHQQEAGFADLSFRPTGKGAVLAHAEVIFTEQQAKCFGAGQPKQNCDRRVARLSGGVELRGLRRGRVTNHLEQNQIVGNKKALLALMTEFHRREGRDPFAEGLPVTYHVQNSRELEGMLALREGLREGGLWIVKPGEKSNQGRGIRIISRELELRNILGRNERHPDGSSVTYIVQQYISAPLLYHRRKFDIRHFLLVTSVAGHLRAYWSREGYVRTSSREFSLQHPEDTLIHLTNDKVQCHG